MDGTSLKTKGFIVIISSPSGAGKTTIAKKLLQSDDNLEMSISYTTRKMRQGEIDGVDYHFTDEHSFKRMLKNDGMLEHAKVFDHYYGTPKANVEEAITAGKDMLFDIDWQGADQMRAKMPEDIVSIFILPPSMKELHNRLKNRGLDSEQVVEARMKKASEEINHYKDYDYLIVNDSLDSSLESVRAILKAERCRRIRQNDADNFVNHILNSIS